MGFILFIHVTVCVLLVISILMQAGRGGGLAESFASAESMFGTQTNAFMVRVSTVLALIFLVTSLVLAFNASKKERSLMTNDRLLPKAQETKQTAVTITPVTPTPATTTAPDSAPKP